LLSIAFVTLLKRKILAIIQRRQEPNVVGLTTPLLTSFLKFIKKMISLLLPYIGTLVLILFITYIFSNSFITEASNTGSDKPTSEPAAIGSDSPKAELVTELDRLMSNHARLRPEESFEELSRFEKSLRRALEIADAFAEVESEGSWESLSEGFWESISEGSSEAKSEGSSEAKSEGSSEAKSEGSSEAESESSSETKSEDSSESVCLSKKRKRED
jgi:hypothetical protein